MGFVTGFSDGDRTSRKRQISKPDLLCLANSFRRSIPGPESVLSVGLESPPGLVVESLTSSILREIAAVGIQITVEGDPDVNVIQLGLHPIVIGDQVWILRALQAIRSSPHAICAAHDAGTGLRILDGADSAWPRHNERFGPGAWCRDDRGWDTALQLLRRAACRWKSTV